jgi:hypothetical protein
MLRNIIIIIFILIRTNGFSQWFHYLNLYSHNFSYPYYNTIDIDFTNENNGVYSKDSYQSPSNGTYTTVTSTFNGGNTWPNGIYSWGGIGNGTYGVYAARQQNTFYYFSNYSGFYHVFKTDGYYFQQKAAGQGFSNTKSFCVVDTSHFYCLSSWDQEFVNKYSNGLYTKKIDSFPNVSPKAIFFPDTLNGYIIASNSYNSPSHLILKSTASGIGWGQVFYDSLFNINQIYFTNASVGYLIGDSGKIVKTIDGGQNWQYLQSNMNYNFNSLFFINDSVGYVAGDAGVIIHTKDGGITWNQQITETNKKIKKIFFVNDSIGFALTDYDVYKINMPLSINEMSEQNSYLKIYPNPSKGVFSVETKNNDSQIEIYTITGKQIHSIDKRGYITDVNLSTISPGLYFVMETKNGEILNQGKLIVN